MKHETRNSSRVFRKILFFTPFAVFVALAFSGGLLFAQSTESGYKLLAPIPAVGTASPTLVQYMKGVFVATIGLAIVLAVVQLVIGGIEYVAAAVPSAKEDAKGRIGGAVGGLLLILAAWIILQALNPKLLNVGLNLTPVGVASGGPTTGGGGGFGTSPPPTGGGGSTSDAVNRKLLADAGATFAPDVSLEGTRASTVAEIVKFKSECGFCPITITAGTNGTHAVGPFSHSTGYKIDMDDNSALDTFITSHYTARGTRSDGARLFTAPDGAIYARETTHWDVLVCDTYDSSGLRCSS